MNIECIHISLQTQITASLQGKKLFKDQCVRCFNDPTSQTGLFICMKCFNGFCSHHINQHTQTHKHGVFTNIKMILKQVPNLIITKLAIGVEGGAVGGDQYDTEYEVYCNFCKVKVDEGLKQLEPQVKSLQNMDSPFKKQSLASWQVQVLPCEHSLTLHQDSVYKDLSHCSDCQLSTNLWLCLTCGHVGCGRKYFDGTGGNNHAIDHFESSTHPLVVKLGTITTEGQASLYCYACNNDVKDEFLRTHMQVLGIDFGGQKKTEKTIAQMNLDANLNLMLSKQLQDEKNDKVMYGKDYTGMNNIMNSCYLNSVVQVLNSLPQFQVQYLQKGYAHVSSCKLLPSQCFYCQISKVAIGLNSTQYSTKLSRTRIINSQPVTSFYQKAISPYDFKLLIAQNNSQFRSTRQQDAQEYLQHLLSRLDKQQTKYGRKMSELFQYEMTNRLVCEKCNGYKQIGQKTNLWKVKVPEPTQHDISNFYQYVNNLQDQDLRKAKACQQPQYQVQFDQCLNFARAGDSIHAICESCKGPSVFNSHNYFKTTPKYLLTLAHRFVLQKWVPKKLNALISMPQSLDVSEFILSNNPPSGQLMSGAVKKASYSQDNVSMLQAMGYHHNAAIRALTQCKDDIQHAINWIMDHMDQNLQAPLKQSKPQPAINQDSILQIQQMGFQQYQAKIALIKNNGQVQQAIQWLFNIGGDVTDYLGLLEVQQNNKQQQGVVVPLFRLKAVIVHLGKSVHSGHYVSYINKNQKWTLFNDEKVTIPQKPLLGKGYLYVYERL